MTAWEMRWGSVLDDIDRVSREVPFIFFADCPSTEGDSCLVVDDDEFESDEDVPQVARRRGFTAGLLANDVQQVMENLRQQDPAAGREVLLRAISYYYERDAFIDLKS